MKWDLGALADYAIWYPEYEYEDKETEMLCPSMYYEIAYWQYSDSLTVDGIEGPVDGNLQFIPVG